MRDHDGHSPILGECVFIDPSALVLGNVHIGNNSSIWPMT
ncbi:MAG: gamma carbonic anhydrase family protein, partial [Planctomycetaceae bacterium]|nr:gamma carbonic anhydrase family protein [Planctomycetaceae bacterium]